MNCIYIKLNIFCRFKVEGKKKVVVGYFKIIYYSMFKC
jgi:hypothetical protein